MKKPAYPIHDWNTVALWHPLHWTKLRGAKMTCKFLDERLVKAITCKKLSIVVSLEWMYPRERCRRLPITLCRDAARHFDDLMMLLGSTGANSRRRSVEDKQF